MFTCPGCGTVDPLPTPAQHCRYCEKYQQWRLLEACAPMKNNMPKPRTDGLCPACGERPKVKKSGYCQECRKERDSHRQERTVLKVKWKYGFCVDCGAPASRKAANGGCLNCRARGRRQEYEAVKAAEGKIVKKIRRRVALEDTCATR